MKLSSLKNKKFQERTFRARKNKKNTPWKNSLHSGKWNFLALRFLYLKYSWNSYIFLYFRKRNFLKNLFQEVTLRAWKKKNKPYLNFFIYIFQEMELSSHKLKKLTYFRREFAKPENQKFLIFLCLERNFQT